MVDMHAGTRVSSGSSVYRVGGRGYEKRPNLSDSQNNSENLTLGPMIGELDVIHGCLPSNSRKCLMFMQSTLTK
jgi:hypothetical protein